MRALALATEAVPLYLPRTAAAAPSLSIQIGPLSITGPGGTGHATLFGVLLLLWRARSRRLRDRRLQREALCRHLVGLEEQLSIRQRNVSGLPTPWNLRPASALAVAAGAISACLLQSVVGGTTELALALEFLVGVGSLGWAGFSLALQGGPPPDGRIGQLAGDVEAYRTQIAQVEREIILLDSE
ncbi:MAG: hypothetical protein FJX77_08770 [Armatimonadetes bacterium]|nr:hypothetical protein [Armatimonadota bacterium]